MTTRAAQRERYSFGNLEEVLELPDLIAIQRESFQWLLDEGLRIEALDRAMVSWGMPMGPIALTDEVGIDVANKVAHIMRAAYPKRLSFPTWIDEMVEPDRLGAKTGRGLYLYKKGRRTDPDPEVYTRLGLPVDALELDSNVIQVFVSFWY